MNKIAIPCSCGCGVLVILEFEGFGDEPQEFYLEFFTSTRPKDGRRARWKAAWRVFRGKDPWLHDVCLFTPEMIELRDALSKHLPVTSAYVSGSHGSGQESSSLAADKSTSGS